MDCFQTGPQDSGTNNLSGLRRRKPHQVTDMLITATFSLALRPMLPLP